MRYIFLILLSTTIQYAVTQEAFISASPDSVRLGEPIEVNFVLKGILPQDIDSINWSALGKFTCPINDSTRIDMDVELVDFGLFKNKKNLKWLNDDFDFQEEKQLGIWKNTFKIIAWEHYMCPLKGPNIHLKNGEVIESFPLNPIPLKSPLNIHLKDMVLGNSISQVIDSTWHIEAPIEEIFPYKKSFIDYIIVPAILFAFCFLAYILYRFFINKTSDKTVIQDIPKTPPIPAHKIALDELEAIKKERTWENGEDKAFVSKLTHVIRSYIEGRYDISALEYTSQEIIKKLHESQSAEQLDMLRNTLNVSDLIKFAKASATDETYESFVNKAIDWVHSTKPINSENS